MIFAHDKNNLGATIFYKSQVCPRKMTSFNDGHYPIKKVFSGVFNSHGPKVISAPGTRMVLSGPSTFNLDFRPS